MIWREADELQLAQAIFIFILEAISSGIIYKIFRRSNAFGRDLVAASLRT
jgi:hypothetical protein